jgi:hypothetical protein
VFCIIVMWIGTVVFAIVVSEASDIIAKANARYSPRPLPLSSSLS